MEGETDNVAKPEISRQLNFLHSIGKTLTGFTYHDEEDGKDKVGFVGKYDDIYYYLKQTKDKGEKWIKCNVEDVANFQREMNLYAPQQKLL